MEQLIFKIIFFYKGEECEEIIEASSGNIAEMKLLSKWPEARIDRSFRVGSYFDGDGHSNLDETGNIVKY